MKKITLGSMHWNMHDAQNLVKIGKYSFLNSLKKTIKYFLKTPYRNIFIFWLVQVIALNVTDALAITVFPNEMTMKRQYII